MTPRLNALGWLLALALGLAPAPARAQPAIEYRLAFPHLVHHVMDVEVVFPSLPPGPLNVQMSRSSPGRYALHEFAKNVFDVRFSDATGRALAAERPNLHEWTVRDHGGLVRMRYQVFGNRIDGTYLAVGTTLAHINPPAALAWAHGLEARPVRVVLVQPDGQTWTVATQLFPTADALAFTAPNQQYLMDSPIQFAPQALRTFTLDSPGGRAPSTIRLALRHEGTDADADAYARDLERIVREQRAVFGELPAFDAGSYTFLATYLPGASGDGMEHRNSTVITASGSIAGNRVGLLGTASHEFFHAWNVERIRPRSLEPFNFADANMSGELWLAEGFTSYYGPLVLLRTGLTSFDVATRQWAGLVNAVTLTPGRRFRSAVDMSRLAPFVDAAVSVDPTNWEDTFLSYYTYGASIALGLDLSLRDLTDGRVSLDDYMRALWVRYGRTAAEPGIVATPYTLADARATLAEVAGDRRFADEFFRRYVEGHDVVDYGRLLARAGLVLRPSAPAGGWVGDLRLEAADGGARVTAASRMGTPAYDAGLGEGDLIVRLGETAIASPADVEKVLAARKPGDALVAAFRRNGRDQLATITVQANPRQEIVTIESTGAALAPEQKQFRDAWVRPRAR